MVLHRYLLREIAQSFLVVAAILTAIFLAFSLTRFLDDAASGLFTAREVWWLTFLKAIIALEVLLPLGFYFGLIVGFGRLASHGETTALSASGMGRNTIIRPLIFFGLLLASIIAALSWHVRPATYNAIYALKDYAKASSDIHRIKQQQFYFYDNETRSVYIEQIKNQGRTLKGIFIRDRTDDHLQVISAPSGTLRPYISPLAHELVLHTAAIYRTAENERDFLGRFDELTLVLDAFRELDEKYRTKAESTIRLVNSADPFDRAELQWRLSTPVTTLVLMFAAFALTDHRPRKSQLAQVPAAIAVYALYYNLLGMARTWVEQETLAHLWWVPILTVLLIAAWSVARKRAFH